MPIADAVSPSEPRGGNGSDLKSDPPAGPVRPAFFLALVCAVVLGVILGIKGVTGHIWEDFFITYRHTENLVAGHGLVYEPGTRVHGFTSPLNVLVPGIFLALAPDADHVMPLWGYTLVSLAVMLAGIGRFVWPDLGENSVGGRVRAAGLVGLLLLQTKTVFFTLNGQEAGFWVGFLLLALAAIREGPSRHWRLLGLAFGGLMWTRPDSPIHIAALGFALLVFAKGDRREDLVALLKAALVCTVLYLPWFAWAWVYYGTPVPHTITAKVGSYGELGWWSWLQNLPSALARAFEPIYAEAGGWPAWLHVIALGAGVVCATAWLFPPLPRIARIASLVYLLAAMYLAIVGASGIIFPWYLVPLGTTAAVGLSAVGAEPGRRALKSLGAIPLVAALAYGLLFSIPQMRVHQWIIEEQTRMPVGYWLRQNVSAQETVFLEPIGYIGYFSQRRILDWPGLVSPKVVESRERVGTEAWTVIQDLKPDWLVLRPHALADFTQNRGLPNHFQAVAQVDSLPALQPYVDWPGYDFLSADARFTILRRIDK